MKKFLSVLLVLTMAMSMTTPAAASGVDLSQMTFDELVALREQLNLAIWNSAEWQEVTVPQGIWEVGKDIPAGRWSVRVSAKREFVIITCFSKLDEYGLDPDFSDYVTIKEICSENYNPFDGTSVATNVILDLQDGLYVKCSGDVVFSPYTGKPDLGFK